MESLFFPLLLALLAGFMFLSIRKQKKRMNEMQDMQNSVATGARVQLTSGMYATVVDASSDFVDLEIAAGMVTRFNRAAIVRVVPTEDAAETYPGALGSRPEQIDDTDGADGFDGSSPSDEAETRTDDTYSTDRPGETPTDDK